MKSLNQSQVPPYSVAQRGDICCVQWATRLNDACEVICFGTAQGYIVIWTQCADPVGSSMTNIWNNTHHHHSLKASRKHARGGCMAGMR